MADVFLARVKVDVRLRPGTIGQVDRIAAEHRTTRSEVLRLMVAFTVTNPDFLGTLEGRP